MFLRSSLIAGLVLAFATTTAFAAPASSGQHLTAQQQRMVDCNKTGKGKKGDDYHAFMKSCLSGKTSSSGNAASTTAASAPASASSSAAASDKSTAQRAKMKNCNAEAKSKSLKGADRKTFMSTCLKA